LKAYESDNVLYPLSPNLGAAVKHATRVIFVPAELLLAVIAKQRFPETLLKEFILPCGITT
jgi:hypothetical protein